MGSGTCLRIFSGFMQLIFAICAVGMIIYGCFSLFLIAISNTDRVMREELTPIPSLIVIVLGLILLIFLIIGCCGVCRESTCCMETYSAFLIMLALCHLALGAYCVITYTDSKHNFSLRMKLEEGFDEMIMQYPNQDVRTKVDLTQEWFTCCGSRDPGHEYRNYRSEINLNNYGEVRLPSIPGELPYSCCKYSKPCSIDAADRYLESCRNEILAFTVKSNDILGWSCIAVGATELIAALFGISLSCCIWRSRMGSWR